MLSSVSRAPRNIEEAVALTQLVADELVGLPEAEAHARASDLGITTRVSIRDEESFVMTLDLRSHRITLHVQNGIVIAARAG
jgi:hypothetical protein